MNPARRSVWAYSLLSAMGALPFLILPSVTGTAMAAGLDPAETLATIAIALTLGEMLAAGLCPLVVSDSFKPSSALIATVIFALLFTFSSIHPSAGSFICWCSIGFAAGVLQYFGTTIALIDRYPEQAAQLRLSLSLAVSGGVIATFSVWTETGYGALKYWIACLLLVSALIVQGITRSIDAARTEQGVKLIEPRPEIADRPILPYLSVLLFFAIFLPFVSILPAIIDNHPSETTLFQMGLGKLIAAIVLYGLSRYARAANNARFVFMGAWLLSASSALVIISPSILAFAFLEIGINVFVAVLLGRYVRCMSVHQRTWMFLMIQLGGLAGFVVLGLLPSDQMIVWLSFAVIAPLGLALMIPRSETRPRNADHF